jgi:FkbH-like protein
VRILSANLDLVRGKNSSLREEIRGAVERGDGRSFRQALHELAEHGLMPADYSFLASRLKELGSRGAERAGFKCQRTFLARSVTIEPLLPYILVEAALIGLYLECEIGSYGGFIDDFTNPEGSLAGFAPQLVFFVSDEEDLAGQIPSLCATGVAGDIGLETEKVSQQVADLLRAFRRFSSARLLVQGLVLPDRPALGDVADSNLDFGEGRAVRRINEVMAATCREIGDAVLFDQDLLAARRGREQWRDTRMFLSARLGISSAFFADYAKGLVRALRTLYFPPRKVLCTDLDETLWGGIVGEDGPAGISTGNSFPGNSYYEYQRILKQLARRGILLAIVSKNNESDVEEVWKQRSEDIAVSLDDFVAKKIGWQEKTESLRRLAQELSLGLDSFVFVDDNPVECAAVRQQLPEVLVVEVSPKEPWNHARKIAAVEAFDILSITEEDRIRSDDYRAQRERSELETRSVSREEFLASLRIACRPVDAREAPLSRTAQLVSKTNQFNLSTRRHSAAEIERMAMTRGWQTSSLRVRDRFGDSGVVGVALFETKGTRARIDTFLLSCRVIGRGIESAFLWYVAGRARAMGATHLVGEYIPTAKNQLCANFYPSQGFRPMPPEQDSANGNGAIFYELDLEKQFPERPWWVSFEPERNDDLTTRS